MRAVSKTGAKPMPVARSSIAALVELRAGRETLVCRLQLQRRARGRRARRSLPSRHLRRTMARSCVPVPAGPDDSRSHRWHHAPSTWRIERDVAGRCRAKRCQERQSQGRRERTRRIVGLRRLRGGRCSMGTRSVAVRVRAPERGTLAVADIAVRPGEARTCDNSACWSMTPSRPIGRPGGAGRPVMCFHSACPMPWRHAGPGRAM